jgi:hypothetical protein
VDGVHDQHSYRIASADGGRIKAQARPLQPLGSRRRRLSVSTVRRITRWRLSTGDKKQ